MAKDNEPKTTLEEEKVVKEEVVETESKKETGATKNEVEEKIRKQIEKKQEKDTTFGIYRIAEYLKEEHKWALPPSAEVPSLTDQNGISPVCPLFFFSALSPVSLIFQAYSSG